MQISYKHKLAFLCMPKCASTSIEAAISPICDIDIHNPPAIKHMNIKTYQKYIIPLLEDKLGNNKKIETFCLMRDPIDWVSSWYRYRSRESINKPNHPMFDRYTGNITFEEFVNELISPNPAKFAKIGNQSNFFIDSSNEIAVDRIFRMEDMDIIKQYLEIKLKTPVKIPMKNISNKKNLEISEGTKNKLKEFYKKDYEIYNNI